MESSFTKITNTLIKPLLQREQEIVARRFGLGSGAKETLDSIGKTYDITRERVRQIQDHALNILKNKIIPANPGLNRHFSSVNKKIEEFGGLVKEESFLDYLKQKEDDKNCLKLLLVLNKNICFLPENDDFHNRFCSQNRRENVLKIEQAIKTLAAQAPKDEVVSSDDIIKNLQGKLKLSGSAENPLTLNKKIMLAWIETSKHLNRNVFGEWGVSSSCLISPKGIKDHAFLAMKRHGSPMHFKEVAKAIETHFKRNAHVQTVHNELIKDKRFTLVGRGLYALNEWGYASGTVRDVIKNILASGRPMSKKELMKRILKERHVKEATIAINLQNRELFKKHADGTYGLV